MGRNKDTKKNRDSRLNFKKRTAKMTCLKKCIYKVSGNSHSYTRAD